jgi:HNH endonuclease
MHINSLDTAATLSDAELLATVKRLAANERHATVQLITHLAEMDARRLYLAEGCSSLFTYCTQVLHLSEHAAYGRIEAARTARKFPAILDAVASGALHLTAVNVIAPHLTADNVHRVIAAATYKTKRNVEELVAALHPRPPVPSSVRKLPQITQGELPDRATRVQADLSVVDREAGAPRATDVVREPSGVAEVQTPDQLLPRAAIRPLAPEQYLVKFTASRAMHERLREAQALLRHQVPSGDVAEIFDRALTLLLAELRKARHAAAPRPRSTDRTRKTGRYVAAAVKREVWGRDGGQCAFVGAAGRCTERGFLEYHHVIPFADGGATDAANLQLRCRAHNGFEAERWAGVGEEDLLREVSAIYDSESPSVIDGLHAGCFDTPVGYELGPGPS